MLEEHGLPPFEIGQLNDQLSDLKRGNSDALDRILEMVGKRMFALARGIAQNSADAEDIVSESFLKIARGIRSFRDGTNGYAWIMRIVRNTSFDFLRKRKRTATENIDEFFHLTDARYSSDRRDEALMVEEALKKLSKIERGLIYYRYFLDFTVREIAREMNMSKSAAERALQGAEKKLKFFLDENLGDMRDEEGEKVRYKYANYEKG